MNYVYKITCIPNDKIYIGITSKSIEERWKEHVLVAKNKNSKDYNALFKKAIRKYGTDNFKIEVLDRTESWEQAKELEKFYIEKYNSFAFTDNSNGYNSTLGGDGVLGNGKKVTRIELVPFKICETYNTVSDAEKIFGRGILEVCHNKTLTVSGYSWMFEEDVDNLSEQEIMETLYIKNNIIVQLDLNGNFISYWRNILEASKALNISQGNLSMVCTSQRRMVGGYQWKFFKDYIPSQDNSIRKQNVYTKPVIQYDLFGNKINEFSSAREAEQSTGINNSKIIAVCKNRRNKAGNFIWRYAENPLTENDIISVRKSIDCKTAEEKAKEENRKRIQQKIGRNTSGKHKKIKNITTNTIYSSVSEASDILKCARKSIRDACNNNTVFRGCFWEFVEE